LDSGRRGPQAFSLENAGFAYEAGTDALRAVSLTVDRGERLAILGANGAGKSTLLRILAGLLHPDSGTLRAFGQEISERSLKDRATAYAFRRRVGLVFQNADSQLFSPTVRDEIAFGPLQLDLPLEQIERRIADLAGMLGLTDLLDRPPYRLSGGEKRKVALASVLVVNPDAILLDEPTQGLDPRTRGWLLHFLGELHQAGKTLVTATNDLELVPDLADRALVLNEAHGVEAEGPAREILADARLLQSVNVIHEHAHHHGERLHVHPHFHGTDHDHEH
jgi:cobalt/nickel transport system ATP-binding protein